MSREKTLIKNTIIYAFGNFGSKLIIFFLLPLYTYYLSKSEYGYYDIIFTTTLLLIPILSFQISDGMYRYMLTSETEAEKGTYLTSSIILIMFNISIGSLVYLIVSINFNIKYGFIIYLMFVLYLAYTLFSQAVRGMNKNLIYSIAGILSAVLTIACNIIMIIFLEMRVDALIISTVLSSGITLVFLIVSTKMYKLIRIKYFDFKVLKKLLIFSAPLIPNTVMWWVMNLSDRYLLGLFKGIDANGIYAVANKFPALILTVNSVFYLAWQESAIIEYKSKDRDAYYTNVFNKLMTLLMSTTIILMAFTKPVSRFMVSEKFAEALIYIPFLYLAVVFSAFSSFYGAGYLSSEKTMGAFSTSVFGAVLKVVVGLALIPLIGIQAAAISTLAAFLFLWIMRIYQTGKYFKIKVDYRTFSILLTILASYMTVFYYGNSIVEVFFMVASIPLFFIFNKDFVKRLAGYTWKLSTRIRKDNGVNRGV
jgi:O-antigen/teichoic acid export membrane protein